MKTILKPFLKYYLKCLCKIALFIHRPTIIAIAGSTNKSFVKNEIKNALTQMGLSVRANPNNFNTEFGLPLAVLELPSGYNSFKNWLPAIKEAPGKIFTKNFPKYLVLSLGSSDPGDIKYLLSIIKPNISIITDITQRYLEGFSDMDSMIEEYKHLATKTPRNGLLIMNHDNEKLRLIKSEAKTIFFGSSDSADWQICDLCDTDNGQRAVIKHLDETHEIQINKYGKHHVYAHLIAEIIKKSKTLNG
jgi:UDP-N-acetylmuramoyl-tripeptide--D-alanyl-D-alanine ligase